MTLNCDCRIDDVAIQKFLVPSGPYNVGDKVTFTNGETTFRANIRTTDNLNLESVGTVIIAF